MKPLILISFCFSILFFLSTKLLGQENRIIGDWYNAEKDAVISMHYGQYTDQDSDKIYGKIIWLEDPKDEEGNSRRDKENPDKSLRKRTILGLTVITDLEWDGDEYDWEWEDGSAYDPKSGNTYSFQTEIDPDNPDIMNCRGFLGFSLLGRTEVWTRKK